MKTILKSLMYTLLIIVSVLLLLWVSDDYSLLSSETYKSKGISNIDIEIINKEINITIKLSKNISCRDIVRVMQFEEVEISNVIYTPLCQKINSKLARVIYSKSIPL